MIKQDPIRIVCVALIAGLGASTSSFANGKLSSDALEFFEEPIAFDLFGFTATYNQLVDAPVVYDFTRREIDLHPRASFQITVERQLPNALTVGATYFGSYDERDRDEYEDRWGGYVSGVWGKLSGGEVNESVREATRRIRGAGNASLEFDDFIGGLRKDGLGGAYQLRLSAVTLNLGVDENAHVDAGITYRRPNDILDLRVTGRFVHSETESANGGVRFDTYGGSLVGQLEYGSLTTDVGLGFEHLDGRGAKGNRYYVSAGANYKLRAFTFSAEGHWGSLDGNREISAAAGARYDIARGLSWNLGYNFAKTNADIDGVAIRSVDTSELISSFRYEF